jgi:hypothetical protein
LVGNQLVLVLVYQRIKLELYIKHLYNTKDLWSLESEMGEQKFWELAKTPESQNSRITKLPITKLPNHKTPDQVNVRQINGVFSKFLL